ncbi:MAG: hypothetical protein NTY38_16525 [Acidobacteria bacterium]|nr:hypothetical protein [Acidobacteriota bacterium]
MPLLLRTVRQNRWLKAPAAPFLAAGDVPADTLGDLRTQENLLSVWEISGDRSNLERVVRAVAIGQERIADTGYVVFDSELLLAAGIEIRANEGRSLDKAANCWHRDLVVSGNRLVALAKAILRHGESGTILKRRLKDLIQDGVEAKELPENLRAKC